MAIALRTQAAGFDEVTVADLIPTQRFDTQIVQEMADTASEYGRMRTRVLLVGGSKGPNYLRVALDTLAAELPNAHRMTLRGLTHEGPENDGQPGVVARVLQDFFTAP